MFSPDAGFPLKLDPSEDESGLGYCLRVASSNGANLFTLKRFLGIRESKQITREHAYALSGLLEGRQDWLQSRLIESYGIHHGPRSYCGHSVYVHNHLRFRRPQVCPLCVHNPGYCSAIWDFSLSTLCSKHHCALVDTCAKCGKALDWNRPSVDVNACSHYVEAAKHPKPIDACLWELQALVDAKFRKENMAAISTAAVGWRALTAALMATQIPPLVATPNSSTRRAA